MFKLRDIKQLINQFQKLEEKFKQEVGYRQKSRYSTFKSTSHRERRRFDQTRATFIRFVSSKGVHNFFSLLSFLFNVELFSSIESHGGRTIPICLGIYFPSNKKVPFQPYPTRIREYGRSIKIVRELPWNRWTPPRSSGYFVLKAPRSEIRTHRDRREKGKSGTRREISLLVSD